MGYRNLPAILEPLVHSPEMARAHVQSQVIDQSRDQRQLLCRPDRSANAHRIIRRGLFPCTDVLQRLSQVELLVYIEHHHLEARPRQPKHLLRRQGGGVTHQLAVERGVIPPVRSNRTQFSWHDAQSLSKALLIKQLRPSASFSGSTSFPLKP